MMYDYVIVGGGVAGLYLATKLRNKQVLLIEEHKNLGPRRCSGLISDRINKFFDLPKFIVERKIYKAYLCCGEASAQINLNSVVLDKEKFEIFLLRKAKKNVEVKFERVIKISDDSQGVVVATSQGVYRTKYVIGCDGANSLVRKTFLDEEPKKFFFGKFCYSKEKPSDEYKVFFDSKYSDLFAWTAPRRNKVEYGLICEKNLNRNYDTFLKSRDPKDISEEYFGVIPTGLCKCSFSKGILVGNSAGMTKPLTGGGVIYSLMAGKIAARELNKDKPDFKNYEKKCVETFGKEISRQLLARKVYSKLSDRRKQKMINSIKRDRFSIDMDFPMTDILKDKKMRILKSFFGK